MPPHGRVTGYGRNPNAMPPGRSVRFGGRPLPAPAPSFPWNNGRVGQMQMDGPSTPNMLDWKNGGRMAPPPQDQSGFGGIAGIGSGLMDSSFSGENLDSTSDPNQRGVPTPGFNANVDDDLLSKLARWIHIGGRR